MQYLRVESIACSKLYERFSNRDPARTARTKLLFSIGVARLVYGRLRSRLTLTFRDNREFSIEKFALNFFFTSYKIVDSSEIFSSEWIADLQMDNIFEVVITSFFLADFRNNVDRDRLVVVTDPGKIYPRTPSNSRTD